MADRQVRFEVVVDTTQGTAAIQALQKSAAELAQTGQGLSKTLSSVWQSFASGIQAGLAGLRDALSESAKGIVTGFGVALGFEADRNIGAFLTEGLRSAIDEQKAIAGLTAQLRELGVAAEEVIPHLQRLEEEGFIDTAESATALRDLLEAGVGLQQAVQFLQMAVPFVDKFGRAGISASQAIQIFADAMRIGNLRSLTAIGISRDLIQQVQRLEGTTLSAAQRQAIMNQVLAEMQSKLAQAGDQGESLSLRLERVRNMIGNVAEAIMAELVPVLEAGANKLVEWLPHFGRFF